MIYCRTFESKNVFNFQYEAKMDFKLTEEQEMIRETARSFAEEYLKPFAMERDEQQKFPKEAIEKLGELGFMGMMVADKWGGSGLDAQTYVLVIQELSKVDASAGVICSVNNSLVCFNIEKYGTEAQKEKYLRPLATGKALGAYSLSESVSGSDAASLICFAEKKNDHYLVNGTKMWVTNGGSSDFVVCFIRTDKSNKTKGISAFIVDKKFPGFKVGKKENKLGIRASDTTELIFENCMVPKENILGEEGLGFKIAMETLDGGRIGIAAQAIGIAEGAFDEAVKYAKSREQFGQPIARFQANEFKIADMATRIDASKMLLNKACWLRDNGQKYGKEAAMAKLFASETAMWVTTQAVQIHGGYGYTKEYPVERMMRDAKITEIYEGTSEIQRVVIARSVLNG
jgi:alkylation response protein AidB-like acyl-CoA dehydrogenase